MLHTSPQNAASHNLPQEQATWFAATEKLGLTQKGLLLNKEFSEFLEVGRSLSALAVDYYKQLDVSHGDKRQALFEEGRQILQEAAQSKDLSSAFSEYLMDAGQRGVFLDIMREVGNYAVEQTEGGEKLVLVYDYDVVIDGRKLDRPVNYLLVQIRPPKGVKTDPTLRPYMIIDPRAGHGAGIGGFKSDSQVGVALAHGHPVYFVIFLPKPAPGQTLADVCVAEGQFVREITQRHPNAPKPVIIGNCQGGWAAMLHAASNPDVTGPVVASGAPLSYWAGVRGKNPLRYSGDWGSGLCRR